MDKQRQGKRKFGESPCQMTCAYHVPIDHGQSSSLGARSLIKGPVQLISPAACRHLRLQQSATDHRPLYFLSTCLSFESLCNYVLLSLKQLLYLALYVCLSLDTFRSDEDSHRTSRSPSGTSSRHRSWTVLSRLPR